MVPTTSHLSNKSRAPYGARGLKLVITTTSHLSNSRAQYGARGLKSAYGETPSAAVNVAPRMGRVD